MVLNGPIRLTWVLPVLSAMFQAVCRLLWRSHIGFTRSHARCMSFELRCPHFFSFQGTYVFIGCLFTSDWTDWTTWSPFSCPLRDGQSQSAVVAADGNNRNRPHSQHHLHPTDGPWSGGELKHRLIGILSPVSSDDPPVTEAILE